MLFASVNLSGVGQALVAVSVVAAVLAALCCYHLRQRIMARRESARQVSESLRKLGLTVLPGILDLYSEGNYAKLEHKLADAVKTLLDPKAAAAEFTDAAWKIVTSLVNDPVTKQGALDQIAKLTGAVAAPKVG